MTSSIGSTVLGYPRIGPRRELVRAWEHYRAGELGESELRAVARELRARTWRELAASGLDSVPGNTFSFHDHVLDTAAMVGAIPDRYRELGLGTLDTYAAMAEGTGPTPPLATRRWFDTAYHHLVPEVGPDTEFALADRAVVRDFLEATKLGVPTRPVILGPVTFLLLADPAPGAPAGFRPLDRMADLLPVYARVLRELCAGGAEWVQFDEPAFTADRSDEDLEALATAYRALGELDGRPSVLVAGHAGDLGEALGVLAASPIEGIAVDLVSDPSTVDTLGGTSGLSGKTLVAGVVDGRNVWRTDLDTALATAATLLGSARELAVGTSCSLLHVPYDVDAESTLDPEIASWLAFAVQKVREVVTLGRALTVGPDTVAEALADARQAAATRTRSPRVRDHRVRARLSALRPEHIRRPAYGVRARAQGTHGIGGPVPDSPVPGEVGSTDMVGFVAEHLDGFVTTEHGWVQSHGAGCVRPPIVFGDVARPAPFTVDRAVRAQRRTDRPVKGVLVGPVTVLTCSFVRDDQPRAETAAQIALALRDEVRDLEAAGVRVIQVDEPALRDPLPVRGAARRDHLCWAVESFRLATSGVADSTRIHTHLRAAEFGHIADVIDAVVRLEADVTSVDAAPAHLEALDDLGAAGVAHPVAPGVYDIHSPRLPPTDELTGRLAEAIDSVPVGRLWVRPGHGAPARGSADTGDALRDAVSGPREVRRSVS